MRHSVCERERERQKERTDIGGEQRTHRIRAEVTKDLRFTSRSSVGVRFSFFFSLSVSNTESRGEEKKRTVAVAPCTAVQQQQRTKMLSSVSAK